MNFKRKVYSRLLEWKEKYSDKYAVLLEGQGELVSLQSHRALEKMNMTHIFLLIFPKQQLIYWSVSMI